MDNFLMSVTEVYEIVVILLVLFILYINNTSVQYPSIRHHRSFPHQWR